MEKKYAIGINGLLLIWFMLDMTGLELAGKTLVSQAWREDGIFMLIFIGLFLLFIFKESIGKYLLTIWLLMWFVMQFFSHWSFTIAGVGIGTDKIEYYKGTIKIIESYSRYIPDLYHVIEHILILSALIVMMIFCIRNSKRINALSTSQ